MSLLSLFKQNQDDDLFKVSSFLLKGLNAKFTRAGLSGKQQNHLDYPSLLSLKDSLYEYGIESIAIKKGTHGYEEFETPFVSSVQREGWSKAKFTVVTKAERGTIEFLDPVTNKLTTSTREEFESIDKSIILLLDVSDVRDELNFEVNKRLMMLKMFNSSMPLYLIGVAVFLSLLYLLSQPYSALSLFSMFYIFTSCIGSVLTGLLLWYEIDNHNPFIKEVCGGNSQKVSCSAVLESSKSSMFGISWSVWGFTFFVTFFLTMVFMPFNYGIAQLWSMFSILISPYILFSIFYQWRVIKKWCSLCILVQVVLLFNLMLATFYLYSDTLHIHDISWYTVSLMFVLGLLLLFVTNSSIPIIKDANDSRAYQKNYRILRSNPEIFNALLEKSETIEKIPDTLGIVVGNPHASNEIIKVCNPYCMPCSSANTYLELILKRNSNYRVRIIFNALGAEWDKRTPAVQFFLAVQQEYGNSFVHTVLNEWYSTPEKNLDEFIEKYPLKSNLNYFNPKVFEMREWCNRVKIRATPTLFINNKEVPNIYDVEELPTFLS